MAAQSHPHSVGAPAAGVPSGSMASVRRVAGRLPLAVLYLVLLVLVVVPVGFVVYSSFLTQRLRPHALTSRFTLDHYANLVHSANLVSARNSLVIAVCGTALALTLGASLAWVVARTDVPCKRLIQIAAITPLFIPSLVAALAWSYLAAPQLGFVNLILHGLGLGIDLNIYSIAGIVFVMGVYYAPYSFMLLYSALLLTNPELEQVARVHGASLRAALRRVTLPLVAPAAIGACLLTFVLIIENFAVPQILGTPARISTLPSYLYRLMSEAPPESNAAAAVGVLLLLLVGAVVVVQQRLVSRRSYAGVTGKGLRPDRVRLGRWLWPVLGFIALYIAVSVVLPILGLVELAFRPYSYVGSAGDLLNTSQFSLSTLDGLLSDTNFWPSVKNAVIAGVAAAVIGGVLYFVMGYYVYRTKVRGRQLIEYIGMAPLGIPALILGLGFLLTWLILPIPLYGTLAVLIAVYIASYMPVGFRATSGGLLQVHRELEEAARVSGAGLVPAVLRITIPLIRSGLIGSALLVFIMALREFSAVIFLYTAHTQVMATYLFTTWSNGSSNQASALSLVYVAILGVVALLASRWLNLGGATAPTSAYEGRARPRAE